MDAKATKYTGSYLSAGDEGALDTLIDMLTREKVIERGNPDLFEKSYRSFGVEEAADVRTRARTKPLMGNQRVFALFIPSMTAEAQNSLLKLLEEPAPHTVFFLVVPSPHMLLPTIRSRVQFLKLAHTEAKHVSTSFSFG